MVTYSTNWMGPVSTKWYEDRNIPSVTRSFIHTRTGEEVIYEEYAESYSCGRIDIYGLDEQEYWCGRHEYGLAPMRTEDWNKLQDWLDQLETEELIGYHRLIEMFSMMTQTNIRWAE
jgi:uncharacterized protein YecA (UPF0149 family)